MLVQELSHIVQLVVLQHLEFLKRGRDLIWGWNSSHFSYACLKKLVLWLDNAFIVPQKLPQLSDTGHVFLLVVHCVGSRLLVENSEVAHSFVNFLHEFLQLWKIFSEFLDNFLLVVQKRKVEQILANLLKLMLQDFLGAVGSRVAGIEVFCFESLHVNIRLQFYDFEHLLLKHFQTSFELVVFRSDPLLDLLPWLGDHVVEICFAREATELNFIWWDDLGWCLHPFLLSFLGCSFFVKQFSF